MVALKAELIRRLQLARYRPGERFLSNRGLARTFGVSGQTAHDLIAEIASEGWLERRAGSGTYVVEPPVRLGGVELLFAARARQAGSFGAYLLERMLAELQRLKVSARVRFVTGRPSEPPSHRYPVLWECGPLAARLSRRRRYALVLNDCCAVEAEAFVDCVSVDNFLGGQVAADWLLREIPAERLAVFSGPRDDERSRERVSGFLSVARNAGVVRGGSWFFPEALSVAPRLLGFDGVFCCNDRLAEAALATARRGEKSFRALVGFDGAPISRRLRFTTVALPWTRLVKAAGEVIERRLSGDRRRAGAQVFAPQLVEGETDLV